MAGPPDYRSSGGPDMGGDAGLHDERRREYEREREREYSKEVRASEKERTKHGRASEKHREKESHRVRERDHAFRNQHVNGHGPPSRSYPSNGHPSPRMGPTTRHPLDISHGHAPPPASHYAPPPPHAQPPSISSVHAHHLDERRDSRPHNYHPSQGPGGIPPPPQPAPFKVPASTGLTANQVHTAIAKGTEVPLQALAQANEQTWLLIGAVSEQFSDTNKALTAYEHALRHNPMSVSALTQVAGIARSKEEFPKAIDYYQRALNISQENGEVWGSLGHCYLMTDDLQKAYTAYQQALYRLPNPKVRAFG